MRKAADAAGLQQGSRTSLYEKFVAEMKAGGFRQLFEEKPVLLRLISTIVRQWVETSREFIQRLDADLPAIRSDLHAGGQGGVARIEGGFSDPHNGGRSVKIVVFADSSKIVYKPKNLRVVVAWQELIDRLNRVFREVLEDDSIVLAPSTTAADIEGWDSLSHVQLVLAAEREFNVRLRASEIGGLENVGAFVELLERKTAA